MPAGVRLPSVQQVLELASHFGMEMTPEEAAIYRNLMQGPANAYRRVEEISQFRMPEPSYPRTSGYRPEPAENPYNGWYYKTDIAGADQGLLKGCQVAVKDAICVAGVPMMAGSRILQGFVPNMDATVTDTVLAMFLLGDEFSLEEKRRNFDYYDPLTTCDSSLSVCIQAIMAAEIGHGDKSREYAGHALMMDLGDIQGNVEDGVHIASMGGTWMVVANGLAGMRDHGGRISFAPRAPGPLVTGMRLPVTVRGSTLEVDLGRERVNYRLLAGDELTFWHEDEEIRLTREDSEAMRPIASHRKLKNTGNGPA